MTLTEFLLARIAEDKALAEMFHPDDYPPLYPSPARVLAECEAKRRIVEWHRNWPVLATTPIHLEPSLPGEPIVLGTFQMTVTASRQIAWLTDQEYRNRFGDEPPTAPILALLALPYADHPDYDENWRPG